MSIHKIEPGPQDRNAAPVKDGYAEAKAQASAPIPKPISLTPGQDARRSPAGMLLKLEADLRQLPSVAAFEYFTANETRFVTRSQQSFVFSIDQRAKPRVTAVSAITTVDRTAPLICWIEAQVIKLSSEYGLDSVQEFKADSFELPAGIKDTGYPLQYLVWVPFLDLKKKVIGGLLQARITPWTEADLTVSQHVAGACSYAFIALTAQMTGLGSVMMLRINGL
jgi:hypothetical protein